MKILHKCKPSGWRPIQLMLVLFVLILSFRQDSDQNIWAKTSPLIWEDFQAIEKPRDLNDNSVTKVVVGELYAFKRVDLKLKLALENLRNNQNL